MHPYIQKQKWETKRKHRPNLALQSDNLFVDLIVYIYEMRFRFNFDIPTTHNNKKNKYRIKTTKDNSNNKTKIEKMREKKTQINTHIYKIL